MYLTKAAIRRTASSNIEEVFKALDTHLGRAAYEDEGIPLQTWVSLPNISVENMWLWISVATPYSFACMLSVQAALRASRRVAFLLDTSSQDAAVAVFDAVQAWVAEPWGNHKWVITDCDARLAFHQSSPAGMQARRSIQLLARVESWSSMRAAHTARQALSEYVYTAEMRRVGGNEVEASRVRDFNSKLEAERQHADILELVCSLGA